MQGMVDWPARMEDMMGFVGLTQADLDLVQATSPLVRKHAEALTASVYDHFLKFPEARKFFLNASGEVDEERLVHRKQRLMRWLVGSIDFKVDRDFPIRLLATGIVHSYPPTHRAHLGSVPGRYMIGTISFIQTALAELFRSEMGDPDRAMRASTAWNKLLMVQLDILLAGYVTEHPIAPAPMASESPSVV
jgi:hypothetical protein